MAQSSNRDLSRPVREFALPVETALPADETIEQALAQLRTRKIEHKVTYFYVVDDGGRLAGVIPTRKLLLSQPSQRIRDVMDTSVISLGASATLEEAMEMFAMHRLLAFPVVEDDGRLIGHVDIELYADEAVDVSESQRSADLFQLIGLGLEQARRTTPLREYAVRMPWLICNIVGGLVCAIIAWRFEQLLSQVVIIATFIPLVLTLSESISMQSMTISLQQLRTARAAWTAVWRRARAEWKTTVLIGASCGLVTGAAASFWGQGLMTAAVIGSAIICSMLAAATLGAAAPILLHMLRLDPRVAGGPVVLMIADVLTTSLYMLLAAGLLLR